MSIRKIIRAIFLLAFSLATFLLFIGARDVLTSHEARVIQVARAMAESGWPWNAKHVDVPQVQVIQTPDGERLSSKNDGSTMSVNPWLVPVLNGEIRLQKPPLPYWCSAILFRAIGYGEGMSRLIPAILGAISALIMWDFARRTIGKIGAWYAALVWVSSYFIVDEFRKSMADPYLAFFTLLATWAWIRAINSKFSAGWIVACYLSLALGMLAKGPIIFLFMPIMVIAYHICFRKPLPAKRRAHIFGLLVFLVIGFAWFFTIWKTIPHAIELWRYESIGEISDNTEKARRWWYYLPNLLQISLPWTPLWLMGLIFPLRFPKRRRFFALICTIVIVLIFSLSYVKKNAYLLPMMPLQTLIVAQGLVWLTVIFRRYPKHRPIRVPLRRTTMLAIIFAIGVHVLISGYMTYDDNHRSAKDACRLVMTMLNESPRRSLLVSHLPEEASVYLPLDLRDSTSSDEVLVIADDRRGEADVSAHTILSTPAGKVAGIEPVEIPHPRGSRWKVFKLKIEPPQPIPSSGPNPSRSDTPAPATSSSGSPASRESF
jgi:4-amino-4-deoxy-L-arabinose transferase-like glycosyltransferase